MEQSRSALTTSVALLCGGGCAILGRKICVPSSDFLPLPALSLSLSFVRLFLSSLSLFCPLRQEYKQPAEARAHKRRMIDVRRAITSSGAAEGGAAAQGGKDV